MPAKVQEWVMYGPLEIEIEADYDFKRGEWDGGPATVLDADSLKKDIAMQLFRTPHGDLPPEETVRVGKIVAGIEELAQHHRFSDDAFDFARNVWLERGGE